MAEKDLRAIIEQVLMEMNLADNLTSAPKEEPAAVEENCADEGFKAVESKIEEGELPDITQIDIRKQYLVENPEHREEYAELKMAAPCRLGIGKAGARYKTLPQLEFRAAHSAAQDAVFNDVDHEFVEKMGLFTVQTQCDSKDTYLTRPDLGRKLSDEAVETIKAQGVKLEANQEIIDFTNKAAEEAAGEEDGNKGNKGKIDSLLREAVELVMSTNIASASSFQRRYHIGYSRAGRLLDTMEQLGIVGPPQGSKPREILVTESQAFEIMDNYESEE